MDIYSNWRENLGRTLEGIVKKEDKEKSNLKRTVDTTKDLRNHQSFLQNSSKFSKLSPVSYPRVSSYLILFLGRNWKNQNDLGRQWIRGERWDLLGESLQTESPALIPIHFKIILQISFQFLPRIFTQTEVTFRNL